MRRALFVLAISISYAAGMPQTGSSTEFDQLSRRASASLESHPAEAIKLYRQALAMRPEWAEGWFYLAAGLYQTRQYQASREAFQRAAKLAPDNGAVWGFLGLSEYQLGQFEQALSDIRKGESIGLANNQQFISTVRNHAALICLKSRDFTGAMEELRPLAKMGDTSPATIDTLGVTALAMPYLPPHIPAEKQALVQLAGRAAWAFYAERPNESSALFRELLAKFPNEPGVHYLHGIGLLEIDPDGARAEFQNELRISPAHVPARLQIAILDIKAGKAQAAAVLAREALSLEPANALAHTVLARALVHMGQYAKAVPELETAIKLDPENAQLHFVLGQAYRKLGREADARKQESEFERLKTAHGGAES